MEAVPKLPLICFELKASHENTHFGPKLKQYIAEAYREDPDSYSNEIHQLEGMRSAAVRPTIDRAGFSALIRYFCQLRSLQSRFPMAKGQPAACPFSWKDLYANMNRSQADIRFEMACILYNIAALLTQLGASEPRTTADSLKLACSHFQHAAWAFQHLREQFSQPSGVDICSEIVRMMQEICFAQAQECILDKSIQDTRKSSVIGAVATQVMYFYKNSLVLLGPMSGPDIVHEIIGLKLYNYWHRYLSFKISYIGAIVCLYQGMHAEEQQKMGERVGYYQLAVEKLAVARKLTKYIEPTQVTQEALTFTNDVVEGKRKAAKNENEFIYHEEVPEKDVLGDMKPVCLVKAMPINFNDPMVSGHDVFSRLVPMNAHEASSMYSEEKAQMLRNIVSLVEAKNTELSEFMSSLQLDQLDVIDSTPKVPQEIVDRCAAMNAKAEVIQTLVDSMNNLAETISDVEESLSEIKEIIQEETQKEKEYQKVMGPRPPSIVQTELSRELHKYQEAHARTTDSNQVLHKAMTLHIANLRLLAQPLDVLQAKIPSIDNIVDLDRETMTEMRRVVAKVHEMQTQRDSLVQSLRDAITDDDITSQLLARNNEPKEEIFKQELKKHNNMIQIIETNLAAQENIINKLTSVYAAYGNSRRLLTDVLRKREGLINALITSYDTYEELLGKSQKGQEFYKKLSHNVSQLLTRLRSTCQVQQEERAQLLAKHTSKAAAPRAAPSPGSPAGSSPGAGGSHKLKDYLPYMKNRSTRSVTPQAQVEPMPQDMYYPESIYPTSIRPTPVGSEDLSRAALADGAAERCVFPAPGSPGAAERYVFPPPASPGGAGSSLLLPAAGYSPYTPSQFSSPSSDHQIYANPYYSSSYSTQNNTTVVTDSQNFSDVNPQGATRANADQVAAHPNQCYDPYLTQMGPIPESTMSPMMSSFNTANQTDLSADFAKMQMSLPKSDPAGFAADYANTFYSTQYPHVSSPGPAAYTSAPQNSNTSIAPSQVPSDYSSLHYPYSNESTQYSQQLPPTSAVPYSSADPAYNYATTFASTSQGYTYSNAITSTSSISNTNSASYYPSHMDPNYNSSLAQLDAFDKPIKSHVTGEALSNLTFQPSYQNYSPTAASYSNPTESYIPTSTYGYADTSNTNYNTQSYQNHPGYNFNSTTGNYEYNFGSQNSYAGYENAVPENLNPQPAEKDASWCQPGIYTNAGSLESCGTVQSPTDSHQVMPQMPANEGGSHQTYYNNQYGYQAVTPTNEAASVAPIAPVAPVAPVAHIAPVAPVAPVAPIAPVDPIASNAHAMPTNYVVSSNQPSYIQPGHEHITNASFGNNQASTPNENDTEPTLEHNINVDNQNTTIEPNIQETVPIDIKPPEVKSEVSAFDLLSEIDFSVEQTPLMPEIKVPQISESAIRKPVVPVAVPVKTEPQKEEVIERPAKRDLFSDPSLLNQFTQEVKNLQKMTDSLTDQTPSALNVLNSKWKIYQEFQVKERLVRSQSAAIEHTGKITVNEVAPYDDSRLTLKSDPDAYINASYYKQLAPWCIPLVISQFPSMKEFSTFWKAVFEYKITCIVCLLSEIELSLEMQGKTYWPTAKGQSVELPRGIKVVLEDVTCNVHWTERKYTVASGKTVLNVTHYQINVFPVKIACTPLVLLADKILSQTYDNKLSNQLGGAWIHCGKGGGRSAVLALLVMFMCQVRAGQLDLCEMVDAGCFNLYSHRINVLQEPKYLADAYRTALFYVQGVLCSGTTMFNGEAVSVPSGAAILPPVTPTSTNSSTASQKLSKFSRESFEEMKQSPGLTSGDMKDPLNFLDPLWSLKKK